LIASLIFAGTITLVVQGLRKSKQAAVPDSAQTFDQNQLGPSYSQPQAGAYPTAPPSVSPSYAQNQQMYQQQAPPGGVNAPYYANPNPPSYQTY